MKKVVQKKPRYLCLNWTESLCTGQSFFFFLHNQRLSCPIYQLAVANLRRALHHLHRPAVIYFASDGAAHWCSTLDRNPFGDTFYRNRIWVTFHPRGSSSGSTEEVLHLSFTRFPVMKSPRSNALNLVGIELTRQFSTLELALALLNGTKGRKNLGGGGGTLDWLGLSWVVSRDEKFLLQLALRTGNLSCSKLYPAWWLAPRSSSAVDII